MSVIRTKVVLSSDSPELPDTAPQTRTETDLLGEIEIPADSYYGTDTARAIGNFPITATTVGDHPSLVNALTVVKEAAITVNARHGLVNATAQTAVVAACRKIRTGHHHDQFAVGMIQGGAGTSTNMNANEVIANVALEHLGLEKGRYDVVDPHNDVNCSQSTNDVYPSAVKIALLIQVDALLAELRRTAAAWRFKASEFEDVLKLGRTQLQDAVPMTLGREFAAFATMMEDDIRSLADAADGLRDLNIGGTAIGTGLNAPELYAEQVVEELNRLTGLDLDLAPDLISATQDVGAFVDLSSALKKAALRASKMCHDLRLLSSGPHSGIGDITLPAVQAGSSIMPGKINPVIPEVVNQVAFEIAGHDVTVSMAADNGQLQLNAFEPIIAHVLFEGIGHFTSALKMLREKCIDGIACDRDKLLEDVWNSTSLVTALTPWIGYHQATAVSKEAQASGQSVADVVLVEGLMSRDELAEALDPERLINRSA